MEPGAQKKTEKLSLREIVCYGMGDFPCSMVFNFVGSYLLYFYTDEIGIGVAAAGTVMSLARLIDAFCNPVVGVLSDRTCTKQGKLRPWLLWSALPLAFSLAAVFFISRVPENIRTCYAMATYLIFCLLYTACNVPYTAMMPAISRDEQQRQRLNRSKFVGSSLGSLLSMGFALPLVGLLGRGDEKKGFFSLSILFGAILAVFVLTCFFNTRERIQPPAAHFSLRTLAETVRKSRPWVICCTAQLFHYLAVTIRGSTLIYYAKYYLRSSGFTSVLLAVNALAALASAFLIPALARRISKRGFSLLGYGMFIAGCLMTYLFGRSLAGVFLANVIASLGAGLSNGVAYLILGETIDHSEYVMGVRQQGLMTSMAMFMVKIGVVLSSVIAPFVLKLGGYAADQVQTAAAISAMRMNYIFLPAAIAAVCLVLYLFYHLDDEYPRINAIMKARREGQA